MSPHPLVSIITIFLNEERFLQEAIDSVVAQTSDRWELLLIDDGSTDASAHIARRNAAMHPERIRYLSHADGRNRGKSASRNLGLQEARGEYIALLDGDDVFLPEKVARQAEILDRESAAMVYGPTLYWRRWPGAPAGAPADSMGRLGVDPDRAYEPPELLKLYLSDGGTVPCTCGLMVRRSAALEVGGFDERIDHLFEDQVFIAKICARYPVFVESGSWDRYRQHAQSSSRRAVTSGSYHPIRPNSAHRAFLVWLRDHLEETTPIAADVRVELNRALQPYRRTSLFFLRDGIRRIRKQARLVIERLLGT